MTDIDMRDVDPLRRALVRERIAGVEAYLKIGNPTTADAEASAGALDLSLPSFYRLAKIWRLHRNPAILPGAGSRGSKPRRADGVSPEAKAVVGQVLGSIGPAAPVSVIQADVVKRCLAAGLKPPSRGATWTYVMQARAEGGDFADCDPRVVVGRCWAQLPTRSEATIVLPEIAMVVVIPSRSILGFDISCDENAPPYASFALERAIDCFRDVFAGSPIIELDDGDHASAADTLRQRLASRYEARKPEARHSLITILGRDVGGIRLIHRRAIASVTKTLKSGKNVPLERAAAIEAIATAFQKHNERIERVVGEPNDPQGQTPARTSEIARRV